MVTRTFRACLERAAQKLGSQAALAEALGIDPTRISRLKRAGGQYRRLNFENCLRLAAILDEWPPEILRAAGHTGPAALFEQLCGMPDRGRSIKSSEWELLRMWRELPAARQAAMLDLLKTERRPAVSTRRRQFSDARRRSGGTR